MRARCDSSNERKLNHVGYGLVIRIILKRAFSIHSLWMSSLERMDGYGVHKAMIVMQC